MGYAIRRLSIQTMNSNIIRESNNHSLLLQRPRTENKEGNVRSEDTGKDMASVQALLTKHVRDTVTE